jgi:hypothetical protein
VRNVINIFLYDIETQQFNLSRLEALRPYPPLLDFYKGEGRFVDLGPQTPGVTGSLTYTCLRQLTFDLRQRITLSIACAAARPGWSC